jgi:multiple sugar transport system permease protein
MAITNTQRNIARRPWLTATRKEAVLGWLFAMPWIIGFLVFTVGPMLFSLYTSFTKYNITMAPQWIGLGNFQELFADDRFYKSLYNTFWMVIVKLPIVTVASVSIALLLAMDLPGGRLFRTVIYLPNVLSGVAAVFLWEWILRPNGLLNDALGWFGIKGPGWFVDPLWTKPGLVVMGMWWIGSNILIYLSGIKGIPKELYEAATIDGARGWTKVRHITLPLLSPTIFFQIVTGIIGTFQVFTTAYILTGSDSAGGGPGQSLLFYVLYLYNRAFGRSGPAGFQMGYASAMAWILFIIILAITLFQLWLAKRWVYYESGDTH